DGVRAVGRRACGGVAGRVGVALGFAHDSATSPPSPAGARTRRGSRRERPSGRVSKQRGTRAARGRTLALGRMGANSSEAARTAAFLCRNAVDCLPREALAE